MRFVLALFLVCILCACNRQEAQAPAVAGAAAATDSPGAVAAPPTPAVDTANCKFCADPPTVRTCDIASGVSTTLHWNITDPNVTKVGVFVVDDAGKDSSFAEQPPVGSAQTGPWLKPGLTFKLKDQDGKLLESLTIEGKGC